MFPITKLATKRIGDIAAGNLIFFRVHETYQPAIRVQFAGSDTAAALVLVPLAGAPPAPVCIPSNAFCLDGGEKPLVLWERKPEELTDVEFKIPPDGHLAIRGNAPFISGKLALGGGFSGRHYWNLATGMPAVQEESDPVGTIYIRKWIIASTDANGKNQPLACFPFSATESAQK